MSTIGDFNRPKIRLPGGAGSAALLPTVKRAILWKSKHDRRGLVEQVDFITATGNVDKVITPLGIFTKEDGILKLWRVFPHSSLEEIKENTGFSIQLAPDFAIETEPNAEELLLLQELDPENMRLVEFSR